MAAVVLRRNRPGMKLETLSLLLLRPPPGFELMVISKRDPPSKPKGFSAWKTARRSWFRRPLVKAAPQPPFVVTPSIIALAGRPGASTSAKAPTNFTRFVVATKLVAPAFGAASSFKGVASTVNSVMRKSPLPSSPGPSKGRLPWFNASKRNPVRSVCGRSTQTRMMPLL